MKNLFVVLAVGCTLCCAAQETKIQKKDLPAAVAKAVEEQAKGAEVKGYSKEVEKGKTYYEAETKLNGKSRDLLFDAKGTLVEVEEETTLDAIPPAAKAGLEKLAAGGKITSVESVTKGTVVAYEAGVTKKSGKKSEVKVNADGTPAKD